VSPAIFLVTYSAEHTKARLKPQAMTNLYDQYAVIAHLLSQSRFNVRIQTNRNWFSVYLNRGYGIPPGTGNDKLKNISSSKVTI
jgi:hypothetical protein